MLLTIVTYHHEFIFIMIFEKKLMKLNFTIFSLLAEVANLTKLFPLIEKAVGTFGMSGLDRLLGLQATSILQKIVGVMDTNVFKDRAWFDLLDNMSNSLNPIENVITQVLFFIKKCEMFISLPFL